jgi:hypothetical protein
MAISERVFQGEVPLLDAEKLSGGLAARANNCKLTRGLLEPWKAPATVVSPTKAGTKKTIYRFGEHETDESKFWFSWITDVDVVKAPISEDTSERTYFTGDGYPKKTNNVLAQTGGTDYPIAAYRLGLPMPDTSLVTVSVGGTALDANSSTLLGAYVMTYVSAWGEESAMSDRAIGVFEFKNGQSMTLNNLPIPPGGNYNIVSKRLYRSNTGTSGAAQYQFVDEIPLAFTSYTDTRKNEELGEVCATAGWYEPPDDGFGLKLGANGNAIMLSGRTIHCSVPYALYAWPDAYKLAVDHDLVGCGAFDQGFAILTKSYPYVLTGVDPEGYTLTKLPDEQACVSKRSIVSMLGGVIYASPDGLYMISTSGIQSMTEKLFTREQWRALDPANMFAVEYNNRYFAFFPGDLCLVFDWTRTPFVVRLEGLHATAARYDPIFDTLYLAQGSNITKFDGGAPLTATWRSPNYRYPRYVSLGYGRIEADTFPVTFRLYANGSLIHTRTVSNDSPFRLPAIPTRITAFEVDCTGPIRGITLAGNGEELLKL